MQTVPALIADVAEARRRVADAVAGLSVEQGARRPAEGEWSVQEVVEHLVLAEQAGVQFIWRAAEGVRAGQPVWSGEPVHRGRTIEEVITRTWRFKEEAPPNATPARAAPLPYWVAASQACQVVLEALGRALEGLELGEVIFPHFISGPLDARQRLEFLRWHMEHHLTQISEVRATLPLGPAQHTG